MLNAKLEHVYLQMCGEGFDITFIVPENLAVLSDSNLAPEILTFIVYREGTMV